MPAEFPFENSFEGSTLEELENLAEYLEREFGSDKTSSIDFTNVRTARTLVPQRIRKVTLERCLAPVIDRIFLNAEKSTVPEVKLEEAVTDVPMSVREIHDSALQKAQRVLGHFTNEDWQKMADKEGVPVEQFRKEKWQEIYTGFLADDTDHL